MVAGATDHCEQLRIVDGSTPEVVTWARALVSRQWRHGGAPGHGGWGRLREVNGRATFIKCGLFGGEFLRSPFLVLGFPEKPTVFEHPRAPTLFY